MRLTRSLQTAISTYLSHAPAFMSLIRAQEVELFRQAKSYLKGEILDFGSGDGFFASVAFTPLKVAQRLIGIDVLGNARSLSPQTSQVYSDVYLYDGRVLPFASDRFDTVVSNCVFEHIPDMPQSARELYRVLKPGGYCVTGVMTTQWEQMLWWRQLFGQTYVNFMRRQQQHVGLRSVAEWQRLLEQAGFTVIERTGYVGDQCGPWLDLAHYASLPSLLSYALSGRWVWWPALQRTLWQNWVEKIISLPASSYAATFFVLQKSVKKNQKARSRSAKSARLIR